MGDDFFGVVVIVGPLVLLGVMLWVWLSNRKAVKERGAAAGLGTTNAVQGSENARPDLAREVDRAQSGETRGETHD